LEDGKVIDLDGKKWPDAPADDASSYYKVPLLFSI
jgi:glutaminyl-tRNA synthetase